MKIEEGIAIVAEGTDLTQQQAYEMMNLLMSSEPTDAQKAAYLTAMHVKGETIEEITGSALSMREHATVFETAGDTLEIVGTGGDRAASINISTLAAIVCAACGVSVTKHGNRAASSKCGTADVLEALGMKIDQEVEEMQATLKETNFAFLFAQKYHSAMRYVGGIRREIKIPTIFNILGPLANPAKANLQLLGVYKEELVEPLAKVLQKLGVKRGMVVFGTDGLDEVSISAATKVCEFNEAEIKTYEITPEEFGLKRGKKEDLVGGMPEENAKIAEEILTGKRAGSMEDAVILNAGIALHIAKEISIEEGIAMAKETISSGLAMKKLDEIRK